MIFVCENKGIHSVWNPKTQSNLCEFVNGKYETNDIEAAKMLRHLGYKEIESKINDIDIEVKKEIENNFVEKTKNKKGKK